MKNKYDIGYVLVVLGILVFLLSNCMWQIAIKKSMQDTNNKITELASNTDAAKEECEIRFNNIEEMLNNNDEKINDLEKNIEDLTFTIDDIIAEADEEKEAEEVVQVTQSTQYSTPTYTSTYTTPTDGLTPRGGVNYCGDQKETYYNLNMNNVVNNAHNAGIEGEYWVREDGVKMLGDKVIVAANQDVYPYGSTVETSLGEGIVLDTGGFAADNPTQVDIATDW